MRDSDEPSVLAQRSGGEPRRGRRPSGDVRAQVLSAATRLLAERGFEGTTLQAVADEVGIRKPSVLHHFESKEALHAGVIGDILEHWARLVPQLMRSATDREHAFDGLMRELIGFFAEDPDRARLLIRETLDRPKEFRAVILEYVQPWLAMFGHGIREGQRRGTYRAELDPEQYLIQMLQLIVVSIGTGEVLTDPSTGGVRERAQGRHKELLRIARTSLFNDTTAPRLEKDASRRRTRPPAKPRTP